MAFRSRLRRPLLVGTAAVAATLLRAAPAMAHHCFVPMYTLKGPSSPNWWVITAYDGAVMEMGYEFTCDGAVDEGYAALREAGLPVALKVMVSPITIGDPKGKGWNGWRTQVSARAGGRGRAAGRDWCGVHRR